MFLNKKQKLLKILDRLSVEVIGFVPPMSEQLVVHFGKRDPFMFLISCLLSLRARDTATFPVVCTLFERIRSPHDLLSLSDNELMDILYPIGFYRKKAYTVKRVCSELIHAFDGKVPSSRKELLSLHGVGHKTAALVLTEAFGVPAICVDTHVFRIAHAAGLVQSKTPDLVEIELMDICPRERWFEINRLFVMYGQNLCKPWSKNCKNCIRPELCAWIRS